MRQTAESRIGRSDGYRSASIGPNEGHTRRGIHDGQRSSSESGVSRRHTIFEAVTAPVQRWRSRERAPKPEFYTVSKPKFIALAIAAYVAPLITINAAADLALFFPSNPLLGAAEATGVAASAVGDALLVKRFAKTDLDL